MAEKTTAKQQDAPVELPSAKALMKQIAEKEADKARNTCASRQPPRRKKALIERLSKPSGVSDEEGSGERHSSSARRGQRPYRGLAFRFPNTLCTDHGRANNQEPGWENTLPVFLGDLPARQRHFVQSDTSCGSRSSIFRKGCWATSG